MTVAENKFSSEKEGPWSFLKCLRHVSVWLGFAMLSFWIISFVAFEGMLREDDTTETILGSTHTPFFLAATFAVGAILLLISVTMSSSGPAHRAFIPRALHGALVVLAAALSAVLAVYTEQSAGDSSMVPFVIGMVWGFCLAPIIMSWMRLLSAFDLRSILVFVCVAMCPQWMLLRVVIQCGMVAKAVLAAALPIAAFACFLISAHNLPDFDQATFRLKRPAKAADEVQPAQPATSPKPSAGSAAAAGARDAGSGDAHPERWVLPRLCAGVFLFSAVVQFAWTFCIKQKESGMSPDTLLWVFAAVTAVLVVVFVLAFGLMQLKNTYRLDLVYRAAFLFALLGAASLPLATHNLFLAYVFIYGGYSLLFPAFYALGFGYASMRQADVVRVMGGVCGMQYLGYFAGFLAETAISELGLAALASAPAYAAVAAVGLLCIAYTWVFPEPTISDIFPVPIAMSYASLDDKCAAVAAAFGLSPRESDVLTLLARGRNAAHIAEELYISPNTVGTHRRNIYRKLGVHDQQELLSLVEHTEV